MIGYLLTAGLAYALGVTTCRIAVARRIAAVEKLAHDDHERAAKVAREALAAERDEDLDKRLLCPNAPTCVWHPDAAPLVERLDEGAGAGYSVPDHNPFDETAPEQR